MLQASNVSRKVPPWWKLSLRAKGVAILTVPMAALFAALFSVYWVEGDVRDADQTVVRAYDTRSELAELHSSLLDAETAVSGYLSTRQDRFLATYDLARGSIEQSLSHLSTLVGSDAGGTAALTEIKRLALDEIRILSELRTAKPPGNVPLIEQAKAAMGGAQARVGLLNTYEERLFTRARYRRDMARRRLFRTVTLCGILGPLGALIIHLLIAGRIVRRLRLVEDNARLLAQGLPLKPLPARMDEIADLGRQLEDAAYLLHERENKLRESERRHRDIFDQAPIPYEEIDREGVIRRCNQAVCELLDCSSSQILGQHAWKFLAPDKQDGFRDALMERMASAVEAGPFESEYLLEDGRRVALEIRETLILNDRGEVTGVCRSLLDVTERNLAEAAARKVELYAMELRNRNEQLARALNAARSATLAKSQFLASVSHELRTPLNGIIGFTELMHDGKLGKIADEHREILGDVLTSARHLLQLINDVLDLSKVEAGRMEFRPESRIVETLVEEVCDVIRPLAQKKSLELSVEVPSNLTAIIDPVRFKQVLYNYLSNAVKFTPERGAVRVKIAVEDGACFRLDVEDTGIGIAPDEIAQLFQEFQQLPNSKRANQGTGLGLALTRHIVEAQGGSVAVRSVPQQGSAFSAILPLDSTGHTVTQ